MKHQLSICPRLQLDTPIYIEEIAWLEGMNNYTMLYFKNGKKLLIAKTLATFDLILSCHNFLRINRQTLIRAEHIVSWKTENGALMITNLNRESWTVSRRKVNTVKSQLIRTFDKSFWQKEYYVTV